MPLAWKDSFAIGIRQIDLQHQELIDIINELESAQETGRSREAVEELLPKLHAYVLFHFNTEESLISSLHSAQAIEHRRQHEEFAVRIKELQQGVSGGRLPDDTVAYLKRWLVEHIMKTDRELGKLVVDQPGK